jgi:hypothetical protein
VSAHDPPRLLAPGSALDPRLRALLKARRDELPSALQLERIARRLGPDFASPGLEPPLHAAGSNWVVTALVATAVGLGALAWWASSPGPMRAPAPPSGAGTMPPAEKPPLPRDARPASAAEEPALQPAPQAHDGGREAELDQAAPPRTTPDRSAARVRASARGADPIEELLIVDEAQRALASDPERALAHAQRHRQRFPDGHYAQEREVIAIDALLELQRFAVAQRRARAFLQKYPGSSYRTRVTIQLERAAARKP